MARKSSRPARDHRVNDPWAKSIRTRSANAQRAYADKIIAGQEPWPTDRQTQKQLARLASLSSYGKMPPEYEAAFSKYWYKFKDEQNVPDEEAEEELQEAPEGEDDGEG